MKAQGATILVKFTPLKQLLRRQIESQLYICMPRAKQELVIGWAESKHHHSRYCRFLLDGVTSGKVTLITHMRKQTRIS